MFKTAESLFLLRLGLIATHFPEPQDPTHAKVQDE